jgi:hypothetical protein
MLGGGKSMAKKKHKSRFGLRATLLAEIADAGKPILQVAKGSGVSHQVLYRFVDGSRKELQLSTIDKLLKYFDIELKRRK